MSFSLPTITLPQNIGTNSPDNPMPVFQELLGANSGKYGVHFEADDTKNVRIKVSSLIITFKGKSKVNRSQISIKQDFPLIKFNITCPPSPVLGYMRRNEHPIPCPYGHLIADTMLTG